MKNIPPKFFKKEDIIENLKTKQYYVNSLGIVYEVIDINDDNLIIKPVNPNDGKAKRFGIEAFAQMILNKYFEQTNNPDYRLPASAASDLNLKRFWR